MSTGQPEPTIYSLSIGSSPDNDLVFDRPTVSSRHAHIYWDGAANLWMLEDLGSTNGTFLRGVRLRAGEPVAVQPGDALYLGKTVHFVLGWDHLQQVQPRVGPLQHASTEVFSSTTQAISTQAIQAAVQEHTPILAPVEQTEPGSGPVAPTWPAAATTLPVPPTASTEPSRTPAAAVWGGSMTQVLSGDLLQQLKERAAEVVQPVVEAPAPAPDAPVLSIGYADDNAVQIKNPVVSGHHARLYRVDDGFILEDQGSTNGTWFGGQRVYRVALTESDAFSLGNHRLAVANLLRYYNVNRPVARPVTAENLRTTTSITVGRSPECDVRLDAPMVSAVHAQLTPIGDGFYRLEDLGSTNGTFVNSRENRVQTATVGPSDVVFFGSYRLPVGRLDSLRARIDAEQEIAFPPGKTVLVVGRDDNCDIVLRSPQISRRHAEVHRLADGSLEVRDLGSINGTYVNGERIRSKRIQPNDIVAFGGVRVRLDATAGVVRRDYHGDMMLQAERITVSVPDPKAPGGVRTILDDASFTAYPTEFVGLMGPSGAGKTTLMMALNGYTLPTAGRSLINGFDLYTHYNSFRGNVGYVPQDDIIYRELNVFESLYFTAKLRLPPDTTDEEIRKRIEDILDKLEIQQTRDVVIGDALNKGISGGQRKRVNLAQELITEPALLFLDEPTSGLASEDTVNVMNLLRRLADEGRTIILTIHQPSLEAYRKLDNVIYLFQGRLVYYGPAYPDGITYFHPDVEPGTPEGDLLMADPGMALKALADDQRRAFDEPSPWGALEQAVERRRRTFLESRHYKDYVYDRAVAPADSVRLAEGNKQKTERRGWLRQWGILTRRYFTIKRKDVVNTAILLTQAPIIAFVLWAVFADQSSSYFETLRRGPAALFLLVASAVWFGCSNSAREIVRELPIYRRERMVNLMIPSYVLSKVTVLGLLCAIQCAILLGIVHPVLGYRGSWLGIYGILLLSSMAGVGMGLTLSALVRSSEAAMALVPLLLIPQIVLGGVIMPIHELSPPMRLLASTMVSRWGYEGVLHFEYGEDDLAAVRGRCGIDLCPDPLSLSEAGDPAEGDRSFFPSGEGVGEDVCTILCENARRGTEVTPLERVLGLDLAGSAMRREYQQRYGVGQWGVQAGLSASALVLVFFNVLLFGLVCALLRYKDVEVG